MKREKALEIATRFYTFRMGVEPENLTVKSMEPAGGRIIVRAELNDEVYEVEIDPTSDRITMKEGIAEYALGDFSKKTKLLSELQEGDLFRMEGDCVVWEFYGQGNRHGGAVYGITRNDDRNTIDWLTRDPRVYPCE